MRADVVAIAVSLGSHDSGVASASATSGAQRAARNLARVTLQEAAKLNTLDLVQYAKIVVSTKALAAILARANGGQS